MAAIDNIVPRIRQMLSVNGSYDDTTIRPGVVEACQRLLRDYNFPQTVRRQQTPAPGQVQVFPVPAGIKRPLALRLFNPLDGTYTDEIERREGFVLPTLQPFPEYYWLENGTGILDKVLTADYGACTLMFWYQSMLADAAMVEYLLTNFTDAVKYRTVVNLGLELQKPEVATAYGPMWQDAQQSLSIYVNELEWNSVRMDMHESHRIPFERYPGPVTEIN